ncbi:MAG: hypothetical protein L6R37_008195 [Teloschistes peruensis]|nr:MAG: hypothetical protein L6R37_008195 [Teloschistes peruensis]
MGRSLRTSASSSPRQFSSSSRILQSRTLESWLRKTIKTSDTDIMDQCGLDVCCFLRLLRMILKLFIYLAVIILPILLPLHVAKGKGARQGVEGLDRLSIANVGYQNSSFYWAHFILSTAAIGLICASLYWEFGQFVQIRSTYLQASREEAKPAAILLSDIPSSFLTDQMIRSAYQQFSSSVNSIIMNRDMSSLRAQIQARNERFEDLEIAETKLVEITLRVLNADNLGFPTSDPFTMQQRDRLFTDAVSANRRPLCFERKIKSIKHLRAAVEGLDKSISHMRSDMEAFPLMRSALILFNTIQSAQVASHTLLLDRPRQISSKYIGTAGHDIVWDAISTTWWNAQLRSLATNTLVVILCIGLTLPVALTGVLSQLTYLTKVLPWLAPINQLPAFIIGSLQGFLPQGLLTICLALLPTLLKWLVNQQHFTLGPDIELTMQRNYFWNSMIFVIRPKYDTRGKVHQRALNQLFVGIYIMELYLVGLFALVRDEEGVSPVLNFEDMAIRRPMSSIWVSASSASLTSEKLSKLKTMMESRQTLVRGMTNRTMSEVELSLLQRPERKIRHPADSLRNALGGFLTLASCQ